jgi:nicotinamide-nucleotide amidase
MASPFSDPAAQAAALAEMKALLLREPRWTVAAAESLSCGQVQALLGAISGASGYLLGGLTAYTLDQKVRLLAVDREQATAVQAVSAGVAEAMALGVCRLFGSTLGVSTTGYAEPDRAAGVSAPMAYWAICDLATPGAPLLRSGRMQFPAGLERRAVQRAVAERVLEHLLDHLRKRRG